MLRSLCAATVLLFAWSTPAQAALFAQGESSSSVVEYGMALVATVLVLLVVCWPARRQE